MKVILTIFCLILAAYAVYFPLTYFGSNYDKKEFRISHILLDTKEEADKIKKELDKGNDFGEIAEKYSICESKTQKGDIGVYQRGRLEDGLENAMFSMKEGEISEPIHSSFGWHILKISKIEYYSDSKNFKYNKYRYLDL